MTNSSPESARLPSAAPLDLDAIEQDIEAARKEVAALCNGDRRWTMCIPVDSRDSDEVIGRALSHVAALVAAARRGVPALATIRELDNLVNDGDAPAYGHLNTSDLVSRYYARVVEIVNAASADERPAAIATEVWECRECRTSFNSSSDAFRHEEFNRHHVGPVTARAALATEDADEAR